MSRRPKGNDASRFRALVRDLRSRKGMMQAKSALRSIDDPYFRSQAYLAMANFGAKTKTERKPLIEKMMEKQPEDRYQSMEQLSKDIDKVRKTISTNTTSTKKGLHLRTSSSRRRSAEGGRKAHRPVPGEAAARGGRGGGIALSESELKEFTDSSSHGKLKALSLVCMLLTVVLAMVLLVI